MNTSENQRGDSAPQFKCLLDCFIHILFAHIWCVVHNSTVMKVQVIILSVCRKNFSNIKMMNRDVKEAM